MNRIHIGIDCDFSEHTLARAMSVLVQKSDDTDLSIIVHPFAKHFAMHISYHSGYRFPVIVDETLDEDAWRLRGPTTEVYSDGA